MNHWLVKQEPADYAWTAFVADGRTAWTGVRNFQARNHLRAMREGDQVAYYHSGEGREVVGIASVVREAYPDPTATEGDWSCVDLKAGEPLPYPVPLAAIRDDANLRELALVRQSRLSVMPVSPAQWKRLLELGRQGQPPVPDAPAGSGGGRRPRPR
ncbi:MAG: EVE domain-containing protein [Verrucomicrobiae bacterium]|nr:EVE domain-containing protein [Verrucomicrobiae bacterium]